LLCLVHDTVVSGVVEIFKKTGAGRPIGRPL
jgi:hypothetical protein